MIRLYLGPPRSVSMWGPVHRTGPPVVRRKAVSQPSGHRFSATARGAPPCWSTIHDAKFTEELSAPSLDSRTGLSRRRASVVCCVDSL